MELHSSQLPGTVRMLDLAITLAIMLSTGYLFYARWDYINESDVMPGASKVGADRAADRSGAPDENVFLHALASVQVKRGPRGRFRGSSRLPARRRRLRGGSKSNSPGGSCTRLRAVGMGFSPYKRNSEMRALAPEVQVSDE